MQKLKLLLLAGLMGSVLLASTAWGWGGPVGNGSYGPVDARSNGGFTFNMGFGGRVRSHQQINRQPMQPIILRGVNFRFDSAELTPGSTHILDIVAGNLRNRVTSTLEVDGYASAEGDALYNLDLSIRRARTVRRYLIKQGVPADRLTFRGYGITRPVADNSTESGRSLNRRVELTPLAVIASRIH